MNQDELENCIDEIMANLKPEIRKRFEYCFRDELIQGQEVVGANCDRRFKPVLLTFFTASMVKYDPNLTKERVQEIVNHEVLHTFGAFDWQAEEKEVMKRQRKVNFKNG